MSRAHLQACFSEGVEVAVAELEAAVEAEVDEVERWVLDEFDSDSCSCSAMLCGIDLLYLAQGLGVL